MASHTTLKEKFVKLQDAKLPRQNSRQNSRPKIQKVAEHLRNRKIFKQLYSPNLVSIGPIHHDNPNLKLGQTYKLTWAAEYIQITQSEADFLYNKIADHIVDLKDLFAPDVLALSNTAESLEGFGSFEEKLSWLLFVDGCSLLYILMKVEPNQLDNPKDLNIKVDQLVLVMMDVLLLENQLPYRVLELLWNHDNETKLIETMEKFLQCYHWDTQQNKTIWSRKRIPDESSTIVHIKKTREEHEEDLTSEPLPPTHLLDLQRNIILHIKTEDSNQANKVKKKYSEETSKMMIYRNIQDLRAAGIKLKSSGTRSPKDVDFCEGWFAATLSLPEIVVDDTTATSFLNLVAYEMCPDFKNNYGICTYAVFMDSLIDHPEDVKELRSAGILLNSLGSDEEVAKLFNSISTNLVPNQETYSKLRAKIYNHYSKHYCNKCKTWIAQGYHTYFSNPWAITGFLAASTALALTFVQTWFSIFPR